MPKPVIVPTGSPIVHEYGTLHMKAYPIDEFQLQDLARLGAGAAACFSLAGISFGFGLNLHKDLAMASGVAADAAVTWGAIRYVAFVLAVLLAAVGLLLFYAGHRRVEAIKMRTRFPDQAPYQSNSWLPLALKVAIAFMILSAGVLIGRYFL